MSLCVCVWRSGDGLKGEKKKEDWTKAARQAQVGPGGVGNWKACDVFIHVEKRQWQVAAVATVGEDSGWAEGEESAKKNAVYFIPADKGPAV